jgi:hypothetical protein
VGSPVSGGRGAAASLAGIFLPLAVFGAAFGYLEAAVVVYLRAIYYPDGFRFPLLLASLDHATVEIAREAATLAMLAAVAHLAGRTRWERFGHFAFLFGVWDIVFYIGLFVTLGWPESLLTWDVLFLIPLIWTGPVLAPVLVSVLLVAAGAAIAVQERSAAPIRVRRIHWALAALSLALLLYSFMANHALVYAGGVPVSFPWIPFAAGLLLGTGLALHLILAK